jgi:hypothetical protein
MKKQYMAVALVSVVIVSIVYFSTRDTRPKANVSVNVYKWFEFPENWDNNIFHFLDEIDPIENASVMIYNENIQVTGTTNENGRCHLHETVGAIDGGQYQVRVSVNGIGETENSVTIFGGSGCGGFINGFLSLVLYVESENMWYWYPTEIAAAC